MSDSGSAAEKLYRRLDISPEQESAAEEAESRRREKLIEEARNRLLFLRLETLIPVLEEVVRNGKNRSESIRKLAIKRKVKSSSTRVFYYRGGEGTREVVFIQ
ncbi:MAG: hypothetical protein K6F50_08475 [Kiritimatiellae bacterium]|nr:hypothetical protein [Kiritimatiellia bacterium]